MTYVTKPKDNNINTTYPLLPSAPYALLLCFVCTHLVVMCTAPLYSNILPPLMRTHPLPTFHLGGSEAHHHSSSGDQRGSLGGCQSSDDHGWILSAPMLFLLYPARSTPRHNNLVAGRSHQGGI